jgi:hypothetical protein
MKSTRASDTAAKRREENMSILTQKRLPKHFRSEGGRCGPECADAGPLHGEWRSRLRCWDLV